MCGIFGVVVRDPGELPPGKIARLLRQLFQLSESRGKESCGLHAYMPRSGGAIHLKVARPASWMVRGGEFAATVRFMTNAIDSGEPVCVIAHSRLVTNGTAARPENNQPVRYGEVCVIHNGIVVNVDELWAQQPCLRRSAEVDTEVIAAMLADSMSHDPEPVSATRRAFAAIKGAASIAWLHQRHPALTLATNTGDLFAAELAAGDVSVFASESQIAEEAALRTGVMLRGSGAGVSPLAAGRGMVLDMRAGGCNTGFALAEGGDGPADARQRWSMLERPCLESNLSPAVFPWLPPRRCEGDKRLLQYDPSSLSGLRRCSRCILPETFPFIRFNEQGVCNICQHYQPKYKGIDPALAISRFRERIERYRRPSGGEVLVPFSGGRDSCYGLHLIVHEFGLRPVTFTYDWGMVTDLARRNIARLCGALGVPNILFSADIAKKRRNIRRNVSAWLQRPDLGMVPLFMAGDKHFFRIVNQLKRRTGIRLDLWSANPLENTDFKSGFCGVPPDFGKHRLDHLSLGRKARMACYYGLRFMANPRYLNSSLLDTATAFASYYIEPRRDFFFMFSDLVWEEQAVEKTILEAYDFERSPDSPSTWRIGDGTAPFYNYIYVTARGFSEFDTFRSNQIREGQIGREEALSKVLEENRPRAQSLLWYLKAIDMDFNSVIRRVNKLDTMGLHR